MAESTISGLDEIEAMLRQLPSKVEREQVVEKSLRAGASVIHDAAKENLISAGSVDTGLLANTMRITRQADQRQGQVIVSLKPSSKLSMVIRKGKGKPTRARPSRYAHFVEKGTEHSPARPFMRPAVDEKGQKAVETIRDTALKAIADVARKLGLKVT
ncbi:HK97-gp10 family putative phage morphogenesis protein [Sphingobium sp. CFD-2]|uniref:HK97-gp10 family putative phage morphogenesis protein n=1 Tax=Sphingobium sp. CFD-2 TaxID=2878542 RepID=UPI00214AA9FE|nr:HK97-gp10 family putative phage morphogenesis protein [Sphingobium sp. CFD-2]